MLLNQHCDRRLQKKNRFPKEFLSPSIFLFTRLRSFLLHLRFNSDTPIRVKTRREATSHYRYRLIPRSVLNERPRSAVLSSLFVRSPVKCHLLPAGADSHGGPSKFIDNYYSRYIASYFRSFSSLFKPRIARFCFSCQKVACDRQKFCFPKTRRSQDYSTLLVRIL